MLITLKNSKTALVCLLALSLSPLSIRAQSEERKVVKRVQPEYPNILRSKGIGGIVRLEAIINPSGTVKSVRTLGGNAILAEYSERAVKQWVFQSGPTESKAIVALEFGTPTQ
jgi:TonB family protein